MAGFGELLLIFGNSVREGDGDLDGDLEEEHDGDVDGDVSRDRDESLEEEEDDDERGILWILLTELLSVIFCFVVVVLVNFWSCLLGFCVLV